VKENNLRAVRTKWNELLGRWRTPGGASRHAA
jgi:indolepyruvate ferredoxin oxidoreductase